ncbi:MAG: TPM domain-containing protein [Thermoanaerobaculia bacterium]
MLPWSARRKFLKGLDKAALDAAVRQASRGTSGEIRVVVLPRFRGSLVKMGEHLAKHLGMTSLPERNGVLILVDPTHRKFLVWGDAAVHERLGSGFFKEAADSIADFFRKGDFTGGLRHGIETLGRALAEHYPKEGV